MHLPLPADPRCFAASTDDPYVALAEQWLRSVTAAQREVVSPALALRCRDALEQARDGEISGALRCATSPAVYRCLASALDAAVHAAGEDGVVLRLFAFPLLIITGGRAGAVVPGVVRDVARVKQVLQNSGAVGQARNFGLSNALCSADALTAMQPSRLRALTRGGAESNLEALDLPPADLRTTTRDEQVHLRFLTGAAITPSDAPSFLETGSAIAVWGMPLTQELADQLKVDGLSVLPIPRQPATLTAAPTAGWIAREDLDLQAFVSRALRRLRSEAGEPEATVAALDSGRAGGGSKHLGFAAAHLAVRFTSPFAGERVEVHRRALHPSEELSAVVADLLALLEACRVRSVAVLPGLVAAGAFAAARAPAT